MKRKGFFLKEQRICKDIDCGNSARGINSTQLVVVIGPWPEEHRMDLV